MPDRRLHLLVEGQTERIVVRDVLQPYLETIGWRGSGSIITKRRRGAGSNSRGGVTSGGKLVPEIRRLLHGRSIDLLTTVIDYYGFPADGPGMAARTQGDPLQGVRDVEGAMSEVIGDRRFVPHLTLHELESWVFAAAD